ncbi:hypothetical protein NA57DRAFT_53320 [Rhizodiscina lignyota]|uniref:Uncharacterized protein n=1 Tax=Rhizodiscina lignyota TaxID=1504668 RepID=A0A9P4IGL0_9PEZI|nr:hypothetical protein NA57DRAFT_53320 [Rhizodiscina lignyota]
MGSNLFGLCCASAGVYKRHMAVVFQNSQHFDGILSTSLDGSPATELKSLSAQWVGFDNETRAKEDEIIRDFLPASHGFVSLGQSEITDLKLPESEVNPEKPDENFYYVAGWHQLHCATLVRNNLLLLAEGAHFNWNHTFHCLEVVREGIMCNFDTSLLMITGLTFDEDNPSELPIPNGQLHSCTNMASMRAWADARPGHP